MGNRVIGTGFVGEGASDTGGRWESRFQNAGFDDEGGARHSQLGHLARIIIELPIRFPLLSDDRDDDRNREDGMRALRRAQRLPQSVSKAPPAGAVPRRMPRPYRCVAPASSGAGVYRTRRKVAAAGDAGFLFIRACSNHMLWQHTTTEALREISHDVPRRRPHQEPE